MVEVSVVIPVYNVEKYIYDSVMSVIEQTYRAFEVIIVDDGSQDGSVDIAEKLLASSGLEFCVVRQPNAGQGAARNAGLLKAKGEWVYFLDSDDIIAQNAIEKMLAAAKLNNADMVFCRYKKIDSSSEAQKGSKEGQTAVFSANQLQESFLKRNSSILAPGTLYKKRFLEENNLLFEKIPWSEDQKFMWILLCHIGVAVFVDAEFYYYLQRDGSIMNNTKPEKMIESYESICKLEAYYEKNQKIARFIVPRWVMGTLNSATLMLGYREWRKLAKELSCFNNFCRLLNFPSMGVRLSSFLGILFPYAYYMLTRFRKRLSAKL